MSKERAAKWKETFGASYDGSGNEAISENEDNFAESDDTCISDNSEASFIFGQNAEKNDDPEFESEGKV